LNYLSDFFNQPKSAYWVVVNKQNVVMGGAGVGPLKGNLAGWCELQKMYFKPELRGLGFGKKLIQQCLDFAAHQGFENCYLETLPNMTAAQKLYKVNGFEYINTRMGVTGHTSCNVFMAKKLHQSELR
jgi:putative acetyltransferase